VAGDLALGHYTHEKSPLGAAAALATIALLRGEDLPGRATRMGTRLRAMLGELAGRRRLVGT
jgi:4-aminobutyrate aminotransferase